VSCDGAPTGGPGGPGARWEDDPRTRINLRPFSADAKVETFEELRLDLEAPRHPSDGGGRVWLGAVEVARDGVDFVPAERGADGRPIVHVDGLARFEIVYEAGPLGVAKDGVVFLQASPFWDWDTPQTSHPEDPGYTEVSTTAPGVELQASAVASQLLAIQIEGRALTHGEQIRIHYGAGPAGTHVDRYAESAARLWIAVDGDGDGVRSLVDDPPSVRVVAGAPAQLLALLPSTARPGEELRLTVALLDRTGNAGVAYEGDVTLLDLPDGLELPRRIRFKLQDRGRRSVSGRARKAGTYRIQLRADTELGELEAESNPVLVREEIQPLLWGDIHGHSSLSDGTGTPDDYFEYARDVAALDIVALTDHDHWGLRFLDANPEIWERIREATERFHQPGRFVTLLGYEWTSWLQGHRHVLYFGGAGDSGQEILSSMDPSYQTPEQLWQALAGQPALTFAHHSAGGPVSTNWSFAPPPEIEPITEVTSVHGSSEASDSPNPIYDAVPGNFVRDALGLGYRFGFIGSSDSHDGHPGLAGLVAGDEPLGGLAAIRAESRTRASVLAALRARKTYATNGPRIYLEARLDGTSLAFEVAATAEIERIDFVRSGLIASLPGEGRRDWIGQREIPPLAPGEYLYLRVVQVNGGCAWSSPFYPE
jgi:hypothetical protein